MADDVRMDVDAAVTTASAMAGTSGAGPSSAPTHTGNPQSPAQQPQDGEEGGQEDEDAEMNVINTLEVDSERADNDSSLGSDISSCVSPSQPCLSVLAVSAGDAAALNCAAR